MRCAPLEIVVPRQEEFSGAATATDQYAIGIIIKRSLKFKWKLEILYSWLMLNNIFKPDFQRGRIMWVSGLILIIM